MAYAPFISACMFALLCFGARPSFVQARREKTISMFIFEEFGDCNRSTPNKIENAQISLVGRGIHLINVDYVVKKPMASGKFVLTLNRCSPDCEKYMKYGIDFCNLLVEEGMPWTRFLKTVQPRMKCPIKKGTYQFRNATLDASDMMKLGSGVPSKWIEQYTWNTIFEVVDKTGSVLACGNVVNKFQRKKVRD